MTLSEFICLLIGHKWDWTPGKKVQCARCGKEADGYYEYGHTPAIDN